MTEVSNSNGGTYEYNTITINSTIIRSKSGHTRPDGHLLWSCKTLHELHNQQVKEKQNAKTNRI